MMIFVTNDDRMGKNILYLRQKEKLSQEDLCRLVGMEPAVLDAIEKGSLWDIDARALRSISRLFQIDLRTLVEKIWNKNPTDHSKSVGFVYFFRWTRTFTANHFSICICRARWSMRSATSASRWPHSSAVRFPVAWVAR